MCSFLDNTFWSSCFWNICVLLLYLQGLMEKWLEGVICLLGSKDVQMVLIFTGPRNSFHGLGCCHSGNVYDLLEYICPECLYKLSFKYGSKATKAIQTTVWVVKSGYQQHKSRFIISCKIAAFLLLSLQNMCLFL